MNQQDKSPEPPEPVDDRIFDETIFKEHLRNKLILLIDSVQPPPAEHFYLQ